MTARRARAVRKAKATAKLTSLREVVQWLRDRVYREAEDDGTVARYVDHYLRYGYWPSDH